MLIIPTVEKPQINGQGIQPTLNTLMLRHREVYFKLSSCCPYPVYYGRHQLPPSQFHPTAPYFAPAKPPPDPPTVTVIEENQIRFQREADSRCCPGIEAALETKKRDK